MCWALVRRNFAFQKAFIKKGWQAGRAFEAGSLVQATFAHIPLFRTVGTGCNSGLEINQEGNFGREEWKHAGVGDTCL